MRKAFGVAAAAAVLAIISAAPPATATDRDDRYVDGRPDGDGHHGRGYYDRHGQKKEDRGVQLGQRPFYLVDGMDEGRLKDRLMQCREGPFYRSDFSIGHRGAALQFPEHTKESYVAAARQGAGIVECDATFTKDGRLVCRHAECDLHTTTDILVSPLRNKCEIDWTGPNQAPGPKCCTSALTLDEFRTLRGKMDAANPAATTVEGYLGGTAPWRTDLYTGRGTLMTLEESIRLNQRLGVKHTPELKGGDAARVQQVFGGQDKYAQALADELHAAGVRPRDAWPQSFNVNDVLYWVERTAYGRQAVYLLDYDATANDVLVFDQAGNPVLPAARPSYFKQLAARGVRIVAPPMPALLAVNGNDRIVPSPLAQDLRRMGFDIITWTIERSDLREGASKAGFYYDFDPQGRAVKKDSDQYKALDVLAREVKILGIFSDWPATVTYYANCVGLQ